MYAQRQQTNEVSPATEPGPYRFTTAAYHQMADAGILCEDDRVELIDGEIMRMSPIGLSHAECVRRLTEILGQALRGRGKLSVQNPIRVGERSEPEPDLAILRPGSFWDHPPGPDDIQLLIEVSDTTLNFDRGRKFPLYAGAGIREAWLVDLQGGTVERQTQPVDGAYQMTVRVGRGQQIESLAFPDLVLNADEILPPPT